MRQIFIAVFLCACASVHSARRAAPVYSEADFREFYREFVSGRYNSAKAIAARKSVDKQRVIETVLTEMWQEVMLSRGAGVTKAKELSRQFQLGRATETVFAKNAFAYLIKFKSCENAANVVFSFNLGPTYADKAIDCAKFVYSPNHLEVARLACLRPGAKERLNSLIAGLVKSFKQTSAAYRDYEVMSVIVAMCPLTGNQYSELFAVGVEDKQFRFARAVLKKNEFKKTAADYQNFIAAAVAHFQCGLAATVAIEYGLPNDIVEAVFLNPKCFGNTLSEIDLEVIPFQKSIWLFDLSLQAHEYLFARNLVDRFNLADAYFNRIVDEAVSAKDFSQIIEFDPPTDWDKNLYQDQVLDKILDLNEEWFVVLYAVSNAKSGDAEKNWYNWVERAYLRALRRGAFELAAGIAEKHK